MHQAIPSDQGAPLAWCLGKVTNEFVSRHFTEVARFDGADPTDISMAGSTVAFDRIATRNV